MVRSQIAGRFGVRRLLGTLTSHLLPRDRLAYWRSGVVLDIDGSKARVKADSAAGRMTVSILGPEPGHHRALAVIRDHFASIHDTVPGVTVEEKVPVRGQDCKPVDYQYLLKLREKRIEKFLPEGGEEEVSVAWLLEGIEEPRVPRDPEFEDHPGRRFRPVPATVPTTAGGAAAPAREREPAEAPQVVPAPAAKQSLVLPGHCGRGLWNAGCGKLLRSLAGVVGDYGSDGPHRLFRLCGAA